VLDGVALLAEGLHDEIDVYHAREFTAILFRRHPRGNAWARRDQQCRGVDARFLSIRWGSTVGSTVAVFGGG
jgi:hypothetical protein